MGAWGYKNFENDTAMDWLAEFIDNTAVGDIEEIFNYILEQEEFLDSEESIIGLACAEIILNKLEPDCKDRTPKDYDLDSIKLDVSKSLIKSAISSINKILNFEEHSELRELWEESEDYDNWLKEQNQLLVKLGKYA